MGLSKGALIRPIPVRRDLPNMGGFNFVMDEALERAVNELLNLDSYGKSWPSLVPGLTVEVD